MKGEKKNEKVTKRAVVSSIMALVLCCAMLIGTTFAWFTDSVTSGKNKIVAGNLDVELEYATEFDAEGNPTKWEIVDANTNLFKAQDETLWEPGHTEAVYLRVRNAGTLALKYQLSVNVYGNEEGTEEEKSYTNKNGESFKLSDYLVFHQIDGAKKSSVRESLWLDTATETSLMGKLDETGMEGVLLAGAEEMATLVVYMPTSVGNEANQDTAKVVSEGAPMIYLGITLNATQTPEESDSFGNDYDVNADGTPDYGFGMITLSGTKVSAPVVKDGSTVLKNEDATAVATIPYDAVAEGTSSLTLSIEETSTPSNITVANTQSSKAYEVKVSGIKEDNATPITFSMFIGKSLTNVKVYHYADEVVDATYDSSTGFVTLTTTSFSPYTAVFDKKITVTDAETLQLVSGIDGMEITLGADITISSAFVVPKGNTLSLDLGGYTLTATSNSGIISYGTLTSVTNGMIRGKYYGVVVSGGNIGVMNVQVKVDGNEGTGTATAIYVCEGGNIDEISGGIYDAYPDVFGSSIICSPCIYVWNGNIGKISGGTFQSVGKPLRIARTDSTVGEISGGTFKAPYVDTTTMAAYSNDYLKGGITWGTGSPTKVTGGVFYNISGDNAMKSTYNITNAIPEGYKIVESSVCEETAGLKYVAYDAETKTRAHFEVDETAPVYYYYEIVSE